MEGNNEKESTMSCASTLSSIESQPGSSESQSSSSESQSGSSESQSSSSESQTSLSESQSSSSESQSGVRKSQSSSSESQSGSMQPNENVSQDHAELSYIKDQVDSSRPGKSTVANQTGSHSTSTGQPIGEEVSKEHAEFTDTSSIGLQVETDALDTDSVRDSGYTSCISIRGKPILPPVMTQELRKECRDWKEKAIQREEQLRQRRRDLLPGKIKRYLAQMNQPPPQSSIENKESDFPASSTCDSSVRSSSEQLDSTSTDSVNSEPATLAEAVPPERAGQPELRQELNLDLSRLDGEESDSTMSTGSRTLSAGSRASLQPKSFREIFQEVRGHRRRQKSTAVDSLSPRQFIAPDSEASFGSVSLPSTPSQTARIEGSSPYSAGSYLASNSSRYGRFQADGERIENQLVNSNTVDNVERWMYDSHQSLNTVIEVKQDRLSEERSKHMHQDIGRNVNTNVILTSETLDADSEQDFRPRRGSYTLEKPSPLLQAHLERFGGQGTLSNHDMSDYQRTPTPCRSSGLTSLASSRRTVSMTSDEKQSVLERYLSSLTERPGSSATPNQEVVGRITNDGLDCERLAWPNKDASPSSDPSDHNRPQTRQWVDPPPAPVTPARLFQSRRTGSSMSGSQTYRINGDLGLESISDDSQVVLSSVKLESMVSEMAVSQRKILDDLLARQEKERQQLRRQFEDQQQALVQQILDKFPGLRLDGILAPNLTAGHSKETLPSIDMAKTSIDHAGHLDRGLSDNSDQKEVISHSPRESRLPVSVNSINRQERQSENVNLSRISINNNRLDDISMCGIDNKNFLAIPEEAYSEKYANAWTRLTAIGKGFLTRRLFKTEKVRLLKATIRETLACAIQLHLDLDGPPSHQDLYLHGRLLAQLEAACQAVHRIFFVLGTNERMSIIALDRAASRAKESRPDAIKEKRVSSATLARMEVKAKQERRRVNVWSPKRLKLSPRMTSSNKGRSNYPGPMVKSFSPYQKSVGVRSTVGDVDRKAARNIVNGRRKVRDLTSQSTKPAWK